MIIADTGFWVALQHRHDTFHKRSVEVLKTISEPLITTTSVLTETCHLLQRVFGWVGPVRFIESLDQGLSSLVDYREEDLRYTAQLMKKYRDLPMDLADASLVLLAEKIGHGRILSTDTRDFKSYRWKNSKPFENLL